MNKTINSKLKVLPEHIPKPATIIPIGVCVCVCVFTL